MSNVIAQLMLPMLIAPTVAPPAYVNVGVQTSGTAASLALTLPGSRVNGNLLVGIINVASPTSAGVTWPAGWTPIDTVGGSSSQCTSWAYRYVDGSEANPTVTWTGTATCRGAIMQLTGVHASAPIGATSKNLQGSTTTLSCSAITSTAANSLAFYTVAVAPSIASISGWTKNFDLSVSTRQQGFSKSLGAAGSSSGAISVTVGATNNMASLMCEIKRP